MCTNITSRRWALGCTSLYYFIIRERIAQAIAHFRKPAHGRHTHKQYNYALRSLNDVELYERVVETLSDKAHTTLQADCGEWSANFFVWYVAAFHFI